MKKIFIMVAIAMVFAACSSIKLGESTDRQHSDVTIALDRTVSSNSPARYTSTEVLKNQQGQGIDKVDRSVIYRVQKMLKQLGYNPGPLDGRWGPKTQQAIKKFQQDNRLPASGNLDDATSRQLMHSASGGQRVAIGSVDLQQTYSLMTVEEARHLIERHIKEKDIHLETNTAYRKHLSNSDSESTVNIFQGVKFDKENYLVFALCEPAYRMVKSSEDLPNKLAERNINIPDDHLSFTFNGIFYTTVDLEIKSNPIFSYTEQEGFINSDIIPKGGYQWLIGDFGINLGNTFVIFQNPLKKNFIESWRSQPNVFTVKMSLSKEKGILLNLYRP